ncbi:MAG TPA: YhcH/YjgK/YiaL family protein [Spirochaetia bacterium]|nr:YhcH/YjgK/YiaL family protein [Spirochaetia bacterium]
MIYDSIDNMGIYTHVHPLLARVEGILNSLRAGELEEGRSQIEGDSLYQMVQRYETKDPGSVRFESHRRYIDVQCVLSGEERAYFAPVAQLTPTGDYDSSLDIRFYSGEPAGYALLREGMFAVFYPQDAHKPTCHAANWPIATLKIVFKLAM